MRVWLLAFFLVAGCVTRPVSAPHDFLFVWTGAADRAQSDFLAAIDLDPRSPRYAEIVATVPVGGPAGAAHHTEHDMPAGGMLLANAFGSGQTYIFDLRDPIRPAVAGSFTSAGDYMHPHSFVRLPNGNVLATYQMRGHGNARPGGLVELTPQGRVVRTADAADPRIDTFIRPYSLAIVPQLDRVVTTTSDMHGSGISRTVQVWRLSDLTLIKTVPLPPGPDGHGHEDSAEPRLLPDGRTVMVSTFTCGLYVMRDLEGDDPSAEFVHSFSRSDKCAIPVVAGRYWLQTDASHPAIITLDVSDPRRPREVARLRLAPDQLPHWIALAPDGERVVISGGSGVLRSRVLLARLDRATGRLSLDPNFRPAGAAEAGVTFDRRAWPHGAAGPGIPHGAVFSR